MTRNLILLSAAALLSACGPRIAQDRPTVVSVPVAVGCIGGTRPAPVAPLQESVARDAWDALTAKQKAEVVSAQALRHQSYGQALAASTSACR